MGRRCPYFHTVVGLAWSSDSERYVGGSLANGRVYARQVKGGEPDKKGQRGPPGWGLGLGLQPHPIQNMFCSEASKILRD